MVKKILRTGTAALAMTSMFAMTAFAAEWNTNGGTQDVEGDAWTVDPTIEVELPGDLAFGINPLQLDADGDSTTTGDNTQIVSGEYLITNYSDVPVLVSTSTTLEAKSGGNVEILDDAAYETNGDLKSSAADKKAIWLVQLYPTKVEVKEGVATLAVSDVAAGDKAANLGTKGKVVSGTAAEAKFMLTAHAENSATCISGFKFDGAVDPTKTFAEEDEIKVKTTFTLNTLSANQMGEYETVTGFDSTVVQAK